MAGSMRAGGKVVKNVAGYDLVKLYVGSHGTLGIIVDATLEAPPAAGGGRRLLGYVPVARRGDRRRGGPSPGRSSAPSRSPSWTPVPPTRARVADGLPAANGPALLVAFDGLAPRSGVGGR